MSAIQESTWVQRSFITSAYGRWAEGLVEEGWTPYLLTFMFTPLPGSQAAVLEQMRWEVERIYGTHVTRVVRKPVAPSSVGRLPIWFVSPDLPVFKHTKISLSDAVTNDGLHMHATALSPPWSRVREDLAKHFEDNHHLYVRPTLPLQRLDVEPITTRVGYVVGYGRKTMTKGRISEDTGFILPRSWREMTRVKLQ